MALLINDELIWVSIPKCASVSIEQSFYNSNLQLRISNYVISNNYRHTHVPINLLQKEFGLKETICIKRNWFDKFLSSFEYIYTKINEMNSELENNKFIFKVKWEDVDNNFIYETFTDEFIHKLYEDDEIENLKYCFNQIIDTTEMKNINIRRYEDAYQVVSILKSQQYFKNNRPCTYEFNLDELDKFVLLVEQKFGEKLKINKLNSFPKIKNKIFVDDNLKKFIWDKFEKRFEKRNELI
jgi:hypothetical protein